jgi:hypothetical protein
MATMACAVEAFLKASLDRATVDVVRAVENNSTKSASASRTYEKNQDHYRTCMRRVVPPNAIQRPNHSQRPV